METKLKKYITIDSERNLISGLKTKTSHRGGNTVSHFFDNGQLPDSLKNNFFSTLDLQARLSALTNSAMVSRTGDRPQTAMQWMAHSPKIEKELSAVSKSLFGFDLSLCAGAASQMTLHIGDRTDPAPYGGDRSQEYFNAVAKLPTITEEGDGVKCAVGLLAACVSRDAEVYLIDEPDLYLHPPQAYEVGKLIVDILEKRQIFVATHSARFIQGLADAAKDRLVVVRLERDIETASAHVVENDVFTDVKADPILAFTNILEGFFHSQIILCEDEADCLFYRATAHRILGDRAFKNALWLGVNGKSAFKKTAAIAKRMKVPFRVIADFDLLRNADDVAPLLEEHAEVSEFFVSEISWLEGQIQSDGKLNWQLLKENGLRAASHNEATYKRIDKLLRALNDVGIIINRFGEVEHLREPKLPKKGVECIGSMLAENLEDSDEYADLRKFWKELESQAIATPNSLARLFN